MEGAGRVEPWVQWAESEREASEWGRRQHRLFPELGGEGGRGAGRGPRIKQNCFLYVLFNVFFSQLDFRHFKGTVSIFYFFVSSKAGYHQITEDILMCLFL